MNPHSSLPIWFVAASLNACVVGAPTPPASADLRAEPPARPAAATAMGTLFDAQHPAILPASAQASAACSAGTWTTGYYHDDGRRYVWVPGGCETQPAPWRWNP